MICPSLSTAVARRIRVSKTMVSLSLSFSRVQRCYNPGSVRISLSDEAHKCSICVLFPRILVPPDRHHTEKREIEKFNQPQQKKVNLSLTFSTAAAANYAIIICARES